MVPGCNITTFPLPDGVVREGAGFQATDPEARFCDDALKYYLSRLEADLLTVNASFGSPSQSPTTIPTFPIEVALLLTLTSCIACGNAGAYTIPLASGGPSNQRLCFNCSPQLKREEALALVAAINDAPVKPENLTRPRMAAFGASEGAVLPEWYYQQNHCRGKGSSGGKGGNAS